MGLWALLPLPSVSLRLRAWGWELWNGVGGACITPLILATVLFLLQEQREAQWHDHTGEVVHADLGAQDALLRSCKAMHWPLEETEASVSHGPGPARMVLRRTGLDV